MKEKSVKVKTYKRGKTEVQAYTRTMPLVPHVVKLHVDKKEIVAVMPGSYVNDLMKSPIPPIIEKVEVVGPVTRKEHLGFWQQMWRDFSWYFKD